MTPDRHPGGQASFGAKPLTHGLQTALCGLALLPALSFATPPIEPARQQELVRVVRQDCGSCHGMRLTGGLGPPLTREAIGHMPADSLAATIFHGRPGTPMPPWRAMLNEAEALWIAEQLLEGFPEERRAAR